MSRPTTRKRIERSYRWTMIWCLFLCTFAGLWTGFIAVMVSTGWWGPEHLVYLIYVPVWLFLAGVSARNAREARKHGLRMLEWEEERKRWER